MDKRTSELKLLNLVNFITMMERSDAITLGTLDHFELACLSIRYQSNFQNKFMRSLKFVITRNSFEIVMVII